MLTKEDLQAIGELVRSEVRASEERMTARISESEERTRPSLMAYIENDVKKEIRQLRTVTRCLLKRWTGWKPKLTDCRIKWIRFRVNSPRRKWLSPAGSVLNKQLVRPAQEFSRSWAGFYFFGT